MIYSLTIWKVYSSPVSGSPLPKTAASAGISVAKTTAHTTKTGKIKGLNTKIKILKDLFLNGVYLNPNPESKTSKNKNVKYTAVI
jgi:hypothetical protein